MSRYTPEGIAAKGEIKSIEALERAIERGTILEAPAVLCDHNLNLHIELGIGIKAVIPREETQYPASGDDIKDIAILTRVGKRVCFKVLRLEKTASGETVAILSRRAAQRECMENYVSTLIPGDIIPAKVTHLESFGAFVDIGCGLNSLLSIDCISVSRISHPSERLAVGDVIYTVVKSIDERGRVYVSQKELLGSWEENASLFVEGQTVCGIIRSVESYGVFVELKPNLAGLAEYRDDAIPGDTAAVFIKAIIPEKMKVKLIIIDSRSITSAREPQEYFVDVERVNHLDSWEYSPRCCRRKIASVF